MVRRNLTFGLAVAFAVATALVATSTAHARGSWGSSGGSWGSHGSSGGSWGSSGGSWGSQGSSGGSWSSHGSSGGSWGVHKRYRWRRYSSHGSSGGSWGSHGSHGSSGGVIIERAAPRKAAPAAPKEAAPEPAAEKDEAAPKEAAPEPAAKDEARRDGTSTYFTVSVPLDAKVEINGRQTTRAGTLRTYVSRGLVAGRSYKYEISARASRAGQTLVESKTVFARAGQHQNLDFALTGPATGGQIANGGDSIEPPKTTLKLRLPADANVSLSGGETHSSGPFRVFTTTQLRAGETWHNYVIQVELDRGGERLSKELAISLTAGETRELSINFDNGKLANNGR
ncbi:MAG: TIGR03000 domain-containing protein [Planctomycetota bacterium]|nr:TIGR03000 domain-containing protein [Planctomycetota bacterium]